MMEAPNSDSSATTNYAQDVHESTADFNGVSSSLKDEMAVEDGSIESSSTVSSIEDTSEHPSDPGEGRLPIPKREVVTAENSSESSDAASESHDAPEGATTSSVAASQADDVVDINKDEAVVAVANVSEPHAAAANMQDAPEGINNSPNVSLPNVEAVTEADSSEPTASASHKKGAPESNVNSEDTTSAWPVEDAVATSGEMRAIAEDVYDAIVDDSTTFQWYEDGKTPEEREKALELRTSRKREYGKWTCPATMQPPQPISLHFPTDGIVFHDPLPTLLNDTAVEAIAINADEKNDRPVTDQQEEYSSASASGNFSHAKAVTTAPSETKSHQTKESAPVESAEVSTPAELGAALDGLSLVLTRILRDEETVRVLGSRGHLDPLLQEVLKLESGEVYCPGDCGRVRRD